MLFYKMLEIDVIKQWRLYSYIHFKMRLFTFCTRIRAEIMRNIEKGHVFDSLGVCSENIFLNIQIYLEYTVGRLV
jgi:hypothetical protein